MNQLLIDNIYEGECYNCSTTLRKKGLMFHMSYVPRGIVTYELPLWCNLKCYNKWVRKRSMCVDTLPNEELP